MRRNLKLYAYLFFQAIIGSKNVSEEIDDFEAWISRNISTKRLILNTTTVISNTLNVLETDPYLLQDVVAKRPILSFDLNVLNVNSQILWYYERSRRKLYLIPFNSESKITLQLVRNRITYSDEPMILLANSQMAHLDLLLLEFRLLPSYVSSLCKYEILSNCEEVKYLKTANYLDILFLIKSIAVWIGDRVNSSNFNQFLYIDSFSSNNLTLLLKTPISHLNSIKAMFRKPDNFSMNFIYDVNDLTFNFSSNLLDNGFHLQFLKNIVVTKYISKSNDTKIRINTTLPDEVIIDEQEFRLHKYGLPLLVSMLFLSIFYCIVLQLTLNEKRSSQSY